jgi:predicted enzyme related to lactoylglutathione lyase
MVKKRTTAKKPKAARVPSQRNAAAPVRRRSLKDARKHVPVPGLEGWITHTDFSSFDPAATRKWCAAVLGWKFLPSFTLPDGSEYHLFAYSAQCGGGIGRANARPASLPFVSVADTTAAFRQALDAGAAQIMAPNRLTDGVTIAIVRAPGGVTIGLSGP